MYKVKDFTRLFTLHGTRNRGSAANETGTIGNSGSLSRTSVNISASASYPFPVPVPCSVNRPLEKRTVVYMMSR